MNRRKLPVGMDDFAELITNDFFYVDKTGLIKELLQNRGKVNLFTRPRRFGKSLNMSMLRSFFEIGTDPSLFDDLSIAGETALCKEYMGRFPVISITLKDVKGLDFETARTQMWNVIKKEAERFDKLQDSQTLNDRDKTNMMHLSEGIGTLEESLDLMSRILFREYRQKVIILIDEYDVPLQKAEENGYYRQMAMLMSSFFSCGLKSNDSVLFAVITGCLRVAKESIFTGFNNPKLYTLVDSRCDEWFGFTDEEVRQILHTYDLEAYYQKTRDWYDGYCIGQKDIYCPWDVINWCDQLLHEPDKCPRNYWANVSENEIISRFVEMSDETTRLDLEKLSQGESVQKELRTDLTYKEMDQDLDSLWSLLFMTGYLTQRGRNEDGTYRLVIPNREIRGIFDRQIKTWFYGKNK